MIDVVKIRHDFPILNRMVNGHSLVYFDNAASSQKPKKVVEAMVDYYYNHNANVHRGVHTLSDESTEMYDNARKIVANFIGTQFEEEVIFTRNTTESINLIAWSWGMKNVSEGDEILVTELEHHSNLLPWQRVCQLKKAKLVICPVEGNGDLAIDNLVNLVNKKTKLIALAAVSNVLGTRLDIKHVVKSIKKAGFIGKVLVDGAQSVPHDSTNVYDDKIDFLTFSGHKMVGPQGIGVLWVKRELLNDLEPLFVGGGMINEVYENYATFAKAPDLFDAGTPNVAGAVGLAAACEYLKAIGMEEIKTHEKKLTQYGLSRLHELEEEGLVTTYGLRNVENRAGILTFNVNGIHAHDTAQILDREMGMAVRSGHHCNQLLTRKLKVPATVRASFYLYNQESEIDILIDGLRRVRQIMA